MNQWSYISYRCRCPRIDLDRRITLLVVSRVEVVVKYLQATSLLSFTRLMLISLLLSRTIEQRSYHKDVLLSSLFNT